MGLHLQNTLQMYSHRNTVHTFTRMHACTTNPFTHRHSQTSTPFTYVPPPLGIGITDRQYRFITHTWKNISCHHAGRQEHRLDDMGNLSSVNGAQSLGNM
jgi:hypothetical protein